MEIEIKASPESEALFEEYSSRFSNGHASETVQADPWEGLLQDILARHDTATAAKIGAAPFKRLIMGGNNPGIYHVLVLATGNGLDAADIVERIGPEAVLAQIPHVADIINENRKECEKKPGEVPYTVSQALSLAIFHAAEKKSAQFLAPPFNHLKPVLAHIKATPVSRH